VGRLNWLRAGVLGANDGIVSVAGIVIGVAGAALDAHLDAELHIDPNDIANPAQAAGASALAFVTGALLPMLAILLPPAGLRVPVTFAAVLIALALTGAVSAHLGESDVRRAVLRVVIGGALGLAFTYAVGNLFGTAIG
jgi:vacuolar iron transporter family protein